MISREYHSWVETANADNATATATKSAPSGGIAHYVTGVAGGYSAATAGTTLLLKEGATEIARWYVHNSISEDFSSPIKLSPGTAVNLELGASGGAGTIGGVTLKGYTA